MKLYHDLCKRVLEEGIKKEDRTGVGTYSVFGHQMRFPLSDGFPLLTTKKVNMDLITSELIWFINGDTNIKFLLENNNNIWNEWAFDKWINSDEYKGPDMRNFGIRSENDHEFKKLYKEEMKKFKERILNDTKFAQRWGDLGSVYGKQWRRWESIVRVKKVKKEFISNNIETPFDKTINIDISSNDMGLVGNTYEGDKGKFIVIKEYKVQRNDKYNGDYYRYKIKFLDTGYELDNVSKQGILNKTVSDRYYPTLLGVGCLGEKVEKKLYDLLYKTWVGMMKRCYDKNHMAYGTYGGRGVFVDNRWLVFSNFVDDVQKLENWEFKRTFPKEYSLDKDFYGGNCYSKETCLWLSKEEQNLNYTRKEVNYIKVTSPGGDEFITAGLRTLCSRYGFEPVCVSNCLNGKLKTHNGWKFEKINYENNEEYIYRVRIYDQLRKVIADIKTNPESRRIILSSWNVPDLKNMALVPCHTLMQFYVVNGKLSCHLFQRSGDVFLGIPFNIASYALLTHLVAHVCDLEVGDFVHTISDAHIYYNHLEQVNLLLSRDFKELPKLRLNKDIKNLFDFKISDIEIDGYDPHPFISAPVAV